MVLTLTFKIVAALSLLAVLPCSGALMTNPAIPITHQVTVQPIVVSNDDASNTAEFFGNAAQELVIKDYIDEIWAQVGIDIDWLAPNMWSNSFANIGDPLDNSPRPASADLAEVVTDGDAALVGNADATIIDMYFVEIAAGFSNTSENTVNGLAFVGGNGITLHTGDNLVGFANGREAVASVTAHEIGHNLGLFHNTEAENLMQEGGSPDPGDRLSAAQLTAISGSSFLMAVPEPTSILLVGTALGITLGSRRRSYTTAR